MLSMPTADGGCTAERRGRAEGNKNPWKHRRHRVKVTARAG